MKLALYVHDFRLEVGHSNSLIELIRHLPSDYLNNIQELEVVSYRATDLNELFPDFKGKKTWVKVPFQKIKPSIMVSLFYQFWTLAYNQLFQAKGFYRIGIGICCLDVHAVSVQFIHHQWTEKGLEMESGFWLRKLYKKMLFKYYEVCENLVFSRRNLKVFSPAKFLTDFLKSKYPSIDAVTIYSGVNLARFELGHTTREETLSKLLPDYPVLKNLNLSQPIYLFVGAYERKGLYQALDLLKQKKDTQFIVIGSPSIGRPVEWPPELRIYPISFTTQVPQFYTLADTFLFPTIYEPFGLVLFEAMSMGLTIITRYQGVGASELLSGLPEVYFSDSPDFTLPPGKVLDLDQKRWIREKRLDRLGNVSWAKAGNELAQYLTALKPKH